MIKNATPLPPLAQVPSDIVAVEDYEKYALPRLSPMAKAFITEGAEKELLLKRNENIFQQYVNDDINVYDFLAPKTCITRNEFAFHFFQFCQRYGLFYNHVF